MNLNRNEEIMKMQRGKSIKFCVLSCLGAGFVLVTTGVVQATTQVELPARIERSIELAFPGAQVTEVETESWNGQLITEVELVAADGNRYEVFIADDGRIVKSEQEDDGLPWLGGNLMLGLGVRAEREIYRGTDSEVSPVPFLRYENGPLEIQAYDDLSVAYKVFKGEQWSLAIKGVADFAEGYDADDSDYLDGMDELDTIYTLGFELERRFGGWTTELAIAQDVSGEHDGQEVELTVGYPWQIGSLEIRPSLGAAWLSEDHVDYLYGVSSGEARADRPTYSPGSTYELGAELMLQYPIWGNFQIVGIAEVATFGNEIKDSPLVEEDYELEFILGLIYTF